METPVVVEMAPTPVRAQVMVGVPELAVAVNETAVPPAATVCVEGVMLRTGVAAGSSFWPHPAAARTATSANASERRTFM